MPDAITKQVVEMVIVATTEKRSESELIKSLIAEGVPASEVSTLIATVREGFKSGVQFAVMGAKVHHSDDADEVYLYAYGRGKSSMRYTSPLWVLFRSLAPLLLVIALIAFLLWKFVF